MTLTAVLLAVSAVSLLILSITVARAAGELHTTLRRVQALLPGCDAAVHEARQTIHEAHEVLARANRAGRAIETVTAQAQAVVTHAMGRFNHWQQDVHTWWSGLHGNGNGHRKRR